MKPLDSAATTTAWVIVANKPFYPLYVWWLVGGHVATSLWTLLCWPAFLAVALAAGRRSLGARVALPLAGLADTALSAWIFGESSGVEAFFAPCAALAALGFAQEEAQISRGLTLAALLSFALMRFLAPAGLYPWPPAEAARLANLNLYSAASLTAFVGLRFASARA